MISIPTPSRHTPVTVLFSGGMNSTYLLYRLACIRPVRAVSVLPAEKLFVHNLVKIIEQYSGNNITFSYLNGTLTGEKIIAIQKLFGGIVYDGTTDQFDQIYPINELHWMPLFLHSKEDIIHDYMSIGKEYLFDLTWNCYYWEGKECGECTECYATKSLRRNWPWKKSFLHDIDNESDNEYIS